MRNVKTLLSFIIMLSLMLSMGVSAWAIEINTYVATNTENDVIIASNGHVTNNNGTVTENNGNIDYNNNKVTTNKNLISYNQNDATVELNAKGAKITTNDGTVTRNEGSIWFNYGTVDFNCGSVDSGTVNYQHYRITHSSDISLSEYYTADNSKLVEVHEHDGETYMFSNGYGAYVEVNSSGTLTITSGKATLIQEAGIWHLYGIESDITLEIIPPIPDLPADKFTVESGETYNNGHGDVTVNEGGTVNENYGYIKDNYGTVNTNHLGGTIENNYGTVANDKGTYQHEGVWQYSVINNFGTVNSGASCSYIQNHFWTGPTSTIPNAKNYYHELIIDGKLSVSSTNGGDTKDGNGSKWIKAYSEPDDSPENKFDYYYYTYTVTPAEGWILDNDNKPSNCDFSDNGDGTWTIEYIGGEIKLVAKPDPSYVPPAGSGGEPGIPDPGEQEPEVSNPYSVPATADNSNMPLWSALFIVFAAAAIVTRKKKFD